MFLIPSDLFIPTYYGVSKKTWFNPLDDKIFGKLLDLGI